MKFTRRRNIQQFFASLTILSVTFTQVVPALALRPESGGSPVSKSGLEDALLTGTAPAALFVAAAAAAGQVSLRGVDSQTVADLYRLFDRLPPARQNTRDMILAGVDLLRERVSADRARKIPSRADLEKQLDQLISRLPAFNCPTCGAKVAHALLSDPFINPERLQPEAMQSAVFQESERLNAALLALSLAQEGKLLTQQSADGHEMTASTLADLRDLLTLTTSGTNVPADNRLAWQGTRMTPAQLREALAHGQLVVVHVGKNHFVQVVRMMGDLIEYTDPQISTQTGREGPGIAALPQVDFFKWWKGDASGRTAGVALIGSRLGVPIAGKPLSDSEMANVVGCCGINAIFGHFRGIRKILDAVLRLKYRAPDDTGILVITGAGFTLRKVQGTPDDLMLDSLRGLIRNPLFQEQLKLPEDPEVNRRAIADYRKARRTLLIREGLENSGWVTPERDTDPGRLMTDLYNATLEGLYAGNFAVGMGDVGGLFSGWVYTLGKSADEYQALNGPLLNTPDMINRWDITPEFLKLFIRYRLMRELPPEGDSLRDQVLARFDQLADRAMKNALDPKEQEEWNRIWVQYLRGKTILIPPDFNRDPVRHIFHLLDQIVGSFPRHPEWQEAVQRDFDAHRPVSVPADQWNWSGFWALESRYNMPGHAWAALVDWLQDWVHETGRVPTAVHDRWMTQRGQEARDKGFSKGMVDLSLLLVIPEIVMGHGRWAMTGDPKWWNAHPQVTEIHAVVHNGAIEADKNTELSNYDKEHPEKNGEHLQRYMEEMRRAAQIHRGALGDPAKLAEASRIEQAAQLNYGNIEMEGETQQIIKTDTRTIVRHWTLVYQDYLADRGAGKVSKDLLIDDAQAGKLNRPGKKTRGGFAVFDRAGAWNQVVGNLRASGIQNPNPDEVAHRVAMMELAPGSGIATDGVSLVTPFTEYVTSHDRPVDIVIYQKRDPSGRLLYEDYMVTSDQAAGIGLFPANEVFSAASELATLEEKATAQINQLLERKKARRIGEAQFANEVRSVMKDWQEKKERILKDFPVQVHHLKGSARHAVITRRLNDQGIQVVDVRLSNFEGEPLNPDIEAEKKILTLASGTVNPSLGDKGRFQSFMEKHIAEIPMILLSQVLNYMRSDERGQLTVDLSVQFKEGASFQPQQRDDGLGTRLPDGAEKQIARHGINNSVFLKHFGAGLEERPQGALERVNQIPGLKRIFLVGVGSSWRDADSARATFQELLPGAEILVYDPVDISNRGIQLDPRTDLMVGLSWSGTTDSTVRLFNRLESDGFITVAITGKPSSDMGRIGEISGGTINVLSGDESTVATTKGFESVLYSLNLLAVHLSQLAGDPALDATRAEYMDDLKKVADLSYDKLNEEAKPASDRVLDLDARPGEPPSEVMQLAQRYRQRHKLLWVGSRNIPIHREGELKGEEIVSSKDPEKASMVGIAVDIEDSSWQATVTRNFDPQAKEEDKVVLGFDMTDPDKFDAFMEEIRPLDAAGADFHVFTYDDSVNPYYEELEAMAARSDGRIRVIVLPSVRTTLQPLISALYYFRFSAALAKTRGLTPGEMDNSRNLAKSVTVSYAARLEELMRTTKSKVVTILQQATQWIHQAVQAMAKHVRALTPGFWGRMTDIRMKAIQRLPFVLERAYQGFFAQDSWLTSADQRAKMEQAFGLGGREIRRVVIVTDEETTEYAGEAAVDPLGAREIVYPTTKDGKVDKKIYSEGVRVPVKGVYYLLTFDRGSNSYQLRFDPDFQHNRGLARPQNDDVQVTAEMTEVAINGFRYTVDPTSFMREKKEAQSLAFGLKLRAADPELLGVESVKVFRATDRALEREMDRKDTLFVLVSRSNNFHQQNHRIPPVEGAVQKERGPAELAVPELMRRTESAMAKRAEELAQRGGRFITLADRKSQVQSFGSAALGNVQLPSDLDDTSLYSVTYMGLLSIGVKLGRLRGIGQADAYAKALSTVPGLVASVLRNSTLRKSVREFVEDYGAYKKIHIIGGGQAYADAKEYARVMRSLGLFAEAQLNDSAWHGPLAAVDPSREKYADPDARTGINPNFNPKNDTLAVILMTDRRFFDTALGGDAQVYDSRNGRFALIVKKSDESMESVSTGVGASAVFGLEDFPDELGNFANAVAAQYLAAELSQAHAKVLGRPMLPPLGGLAPIEVVPGNFLPDLREDLVRHVGPVSLRNAFGLVEAVRQNGNPRVSVFPDQTGLDRRSVILVVAADRLGLIGDIGTAVAEVGISIDRQHSDNDPPTPVSGQQRISVFMLMVEEPVNAVRGKQVEAAILRVLGAQPPMDFDAAVTAMLEVEKLPVTGVIAEGIRAAHEAYLTTRGEPQVEVFPHPSGDSNKAVLVAVSRDRIAMLNDVIGPVSDEDEMGANLQTSGAQTVGEAAFVILNIGDIGPKGFPAFGAVKSKILGLLSTPTVPDSFRDRLRPFEAQMEGTSVRSMYAAYKNLQGSQPPHYVMRSRYVPDRATQSALTILVRDQDGFGGLDAQIREIIERNQLQIVTAGGAQMAFNVEYQEKSDHQTVRILRYVVNAPRDDPRVINARNNMQEELVNPPAAPTAAAAPPLPALLQPHEAEVKKLVDLARDQGVHFKAVAGRKKGQTLLMIIGPKDEPGVFNIVTRALDKISMDDLGAYDTDHDAGLSYAVVSVPLAALGPVLKGIENSIEARYPTQEEMDLRTQLSQSLNPDEIELLMTQYRAYHGDPRHSVDPGAAAGETYISAAAPYSPPLPDLKKLLTERIEKTVQEKAKELNLQPNQIPNVVSIISVQPTQKLQQVVTEEPHLVVTEELRPAVLVLVSMNLDKGGIFRFGLDEAVEEAISHLSGKSQAGVEEARKKAIARGWVEEMDGQIATGFFRTQDGGQVVVATEAARLNVNVDQIDPAARILPTGVVIGSETKIGAGAQVRGTVIDAEVRRNATQRGILRTSAAATNDWDPSIKLLGVEYKLPFGNIEEARKEGRVIDLDEKKDVIKAVLGEGAVVATGNVELTNTHVRSMDNEVGRTVITAGVYKNTEIGEGNKHLTRVKADVTHFEPLVTVKTSDPNVPVEFAESWIGRGATFTHRGYIEATMPNLYVWAERLVDKDGKQVPDAEVVPDFPMIGVWGQSTIFASYDATMKAKDPRLTKITGKESSIHAWIVRLPGLISSALTLIGRKHGPISDPVELLNHPDLTAAGGFVAATNQAWGIPLSGSLQTDLSRGTAEDPLWLFREHPEAVRGLIKEAWEQEKRYTQLRKAQDSAFDEAVFLEEQARKIALWPVRMLQTAWTLAMQRQAQSPSATAAKTYAAVIQQVPPLVAQFSSIGSKPADLDGISESFANAVAVADRLAADAAAAGRLQSEQEVAALWRQRPQWTDRDEDRFQTPLDKSQVDASVTREAGSLVVGHNRLLGSARLGRGAIVAGSTELKDVVVEGVSQADYDAGTRMLVIATHLEGGRIGPNSSLIHVVGENLTVGADSDVRLSRFSSAIFGDKADITGTVAQRVQMGNRAVLESGARLARVEAAEHVILGGIMEDSRVGSGYTMHHTGAMGFGVTAEDVMIHATGQRVAGNSNHSDGVILGVPGKGENQVFLNGPVMFGANQVVNTVAPDGRILPVTIGFGAFVKGGLNPGEVVANFQFSSKPGLEGKLTPKTQSEVLTVFDVVPGVPLRLILSKQLVETPSAAKPSVAFSIPEALKTGVDQYRNLAALGLPQDKREAAAQKLQAQIDGRFWESTFNNGALELAVPRAWKPAGSVDDKMNGNYEPEPAQAGVEETPSVETKTRPDWRVRVPVQERVAVIELGGTQLRGGLYSRDGELLAALPNLLIRDRLPVPVKPEDQRNHETFIQLIHEFIGNILQSSGLTAEQMGAVSFSSAGDIKEDQGIFERVNNMPIPPGFDLVTPVSRRWNLPVYLSNDMTSAAMGEALAGAGKGLPFFVYSTVSSGHNMAARLPNGKVKDLRTWGYEVLPDGRVARAEGAADHVESHVSGKFLAQRLGLASGEEVAQRYRSGDAAAVKLVQESARILALTAIETIQKDVAQEVDLSALNQADLPVIFGGGFAVGMGQNYTRMIQEYVDKEGGKTLFPKPIRVVLSPTDENQRGLVGAAARVPKIAAVGLEDIGRPAIGTTLPGIGLGAVKLPRTTGSTGVLPSTSGVLGTFSYADTRSRINLLPELRLTTSTAATPAVFGVIAGPVDTRGLAAGIALSRRAFGPDGNAVPVIFIVENQKEEAALTSLGVSVEQIIRVDPSGRYKTVDAAVEQAGGWLSGMYGVTRVVELGVRQPVPALLLRLLENLFGIRLDDSESIRVWQGVIDRATLVLQA